MKTVKSYLLTLLLACVSTLMAQAGTPTTYVDTLGAGNYLFGCTVYDAPGVYSDAETGISLRLKGSAIRVNLKDSMTSEQTYLFACQQLTAPGIYTEKYESHDGLHDSIVSLTLTHYVPFVCTESATTIKDTVLVGEKLLFGCRQYDFAAEGDTTLADTLTNACGMDSVVTLQLHVYVEPSCEPSATAIKDTVLTGEELLFGCRQYVFAAVGDTTLADTLTNACGMDSVVTLHLHINLAMAYDTITLHTDTLLCYGMSFDSRLQNLVDLTADTAFNDTIHGILMEEHLTRDSIYTYSIKVLPALHDSTVADTTICYGETIDWMDGVQYAIFSDSVLVDTIHNQLGCDSIAFARTIKVLPKMQDQSFADTTICFGEMIFWAGTSTLPLTKDTTLTDTIQNFLGCDSIAFSRKVNVLPATIDSTLTDSLICYNQSIEWLDGKTYTLTADTMLRDTTYNPLGCDSIRFARMIKVLPALKDSTVADTTICYGETIDWMDGVQYAIFSDSVLVDTIHNQLGCDSIAFARTIKVLPKMQDQSFADTTICYGEMIFWAGATTPSLLKDTTLTDTIQNFLGCDSIAFSRKVNVLPATIDSTLTDSLICYNQSIEWLDGKTYTLTADTMLRDTTYNPLGCDSIRFARMIKVLPALKDSTVADTTICFGETIDWMDGVQYAIFSDSVLVDTIHNQLGCDSIAFARMIKVLPALKDSMLADTLICYGETIEWVGATTPSLLKDTVLTDTIQNFLGCDSIAFARMIKVLPEVVQTRLDTALCERDIKATPILWHGQTIDKEDLYTYYEANALGCDSILDTLNVVFIRTEVPALTIAWPYAVCGAAFTADKVIENIAASMKADPANYDVKDTANIVLQIHNGKKWINYIGEAMPAGTDSVVFRIRLTTDCGPWYSDSISLPIVRPTPENTEGMDNLPAVSKYGDWLLMVDRNQIKSKYGIDPAANEVIWYRMVGATPDPENDTQVATGYYYTIADALVGSYYALIDLPVKKNECGAIYRTGYIVCSAGAKVSIRPSRVSQGEEITIGNLPTDGTVMLRVYTATGQLVGSYTSENMSSYHINACGIPGLYMVHVTGDNLNDVVQYVVVK